MLRIPVLLCYLIAYVWFVVLVFIRDGKTAREHLA
jgi:hypothetical protein